MTDATASSSSSLWGYVSSAEQYAGAALTSVETSLEEVGSEALTAAENVGSAIGQWASGVLSQIEQWGGSAWNDLGDLNLPPWLVNALSWVGIQWPVLNGQDLRDAAQLIRDFATAVESTHDDATKAVQALAQASKAQTIQALVSGWGNRAISQIEGLLGYCGSFASVLDTASQAVPAMKAAALVELGTFVAGVVAGVGAVTVAAVFTGGAAAVAAAGESAALRTAIQALINKVESLIQQIVIQIIEQTLQPAFEKLLSWIEQLATSLGWEQAAQAMINQAAGYAASLGGAAAADLDIDVPAAQAAVDQLKSFNATLQDRIAPVLARLDALMSSIQARVTA